MAQTQSVDVAVIGAGGGGYPGAFFLDRAGRRVMMVDPIGNLGGDCLAQGCVPSKAVRQAGLVRARAKRYDTFGLSGEVPMVRWRDVLAHKDRVQRRRYTQHRADLDRSHITFHQGTARLVAPDAVDVEEDDGAVHHYQFGDLIIATGSAPSRLQIPGAELAVTSHDLFRLGADLEFPSRPVIVGGGYIGVEIGSMLETLGAVPTIVELTDQLLPGFAPELAHALSNALAPRIAVRIGARVTAIEQTGATFTVHCHTADQSFAVQGDMVVMATGRHAVLPEGIEHVGLEPGQPPVVDTRLRTIHPHVFAPGDVNGRSPLFHSAVRQSLVAAHVIAAGGQPVDAMAFDSVPMTVFSEPEVAQVGLSKRQAEHQLGSVGSTRYDYAEDARAQILDEPDGFIELVWDDHTGRLVGAQIFGVDAAQLIAPLALAVQGGDTAGDLATMAFPHPMLSEGIGSAARLYHA